MVTGLGITRSKQSGRKVKSEPPSLIAHEAELVAHIAAPQRPGLKIRTKLLLLILSLLAIPYMGYNSVRTMEKFLLEGQMEALKLTSEGIATLLEDRDNLFSDQTGVPEFLLPFEQLPQELDITIPFEESLSEWSDVLKNLVDYTGGKFFECGVSYDPNSFSVRYGAGLHDSYFYFLFQITDDIVVFRDPERLS